MKKISTIVDAIVLFMGAYEIAYSFRDTSAFWGALHLSGGLVLAVFGFYMLKEDLRA